MCWPHTAERGLFFSRPLSKKSTAKPGAFVKHGVKCKQQVLRSGMAPREASGFGWRVRGRWEGAISWTELKEEQCVLLHRKLSFALKLHRAVCLSPGKTVLK